MKYFKPQSESREQLKDIVAGLCLLLVFVMLILTIASFQP